MTPDKQRQEADEIDHELAGLSRRARWAQLIKLAELIDAARIEAGKQAVSES